MNVAITGASGFIGRALCAELAHAGYRVSPVSLQARASAVELAGADRVVHLAAIAQRRGIDKGGVLKRVNVDLARAVGIAAADVGAPMIFMSTVKVHGEESTEEPFRENAAIRPADAYAVSKADAEEALRALSGLRLTVLRPPLVYGPGVKANFLTLLNAVARGIPLPFSGIKNRRSLVYVGNLADAVLRCLREPAALGRTYLVSDGVPLSTAELCVQIGQALDRPARLFPFPTTLLELVHATRKLTRSLEVDDARLRQELDWRPRWSVEEALAATAQWYRAN